MASKIIVVINSDIKPSIQEGFAKIYKEGEMTAQDYEAMIYLQYLQQNGKGHDGTYTTMQSVGNMVPVTASGILLGITAPGMKSI